MTRPSSCRRGRSLVVYLLGAVTNNISMPVDLWVITGLYVWVGSLLFAACGLFIGYLLPAENVMQLMGLSLTLCSFAGGLLVPLSQFSHSFATFAEFTPLYGLNQLVYYPLARARIRTSVSRSSAGRSNRPGVAGRGFLRPSCQRGTFGVATTSLTRRSVG